MIRVVLPFLTIASIFSIEIASQTFKNEALSNNLEVHQALSKNNSSMSENGSINGNIIDEETLDPIPFAKIIVFQDEKIVKGAQTDLDGKFQFINLVEGSYQLQIKALEYKTLEMKNVVVSSDRITFINEIRLTPQTVKELEEVEIRVHAAPLIMKDAGASGRTITREDVARLPARSGESVASTTPRSSRSSKTEYKTTQTHRTHLLTAGEINDFCKWELWKDLTSDELKKHSNYWNFSVENRYTVQVMNTLGFPVANALTQLIDSDGSIWYTSKTDNTGKAELWSTLHENNTSIERPRIKVIFKEYEKEIQSVSSFENGINSVVLDIACDSKNEVDIAFVVDATGSMGDEISFLKAELNDVMKQVKKNYPKTFFRYGNVFYRDQGESYVTRKMPFTTSLNTSVEFINNQTANGGGDYEEAVEIALDTAIHQLKWNPNAISRILFLVLDAPPHNSPEIQASLELSMRTAAKKGIRIIPLVASGVNKEAEYLMRTIALATNGTYAFLTNHSGIGNDHIEPSTDSYEVELLNDLLVRLLSSFIYQPSCSEEKKDDFSTTDDPESEVIWNYWPNPTSGIIYVEANEKLEEFYLTDLTGKVLERRTNVKAKERVILNLDQYASGVYLLRSPVGKKWKTAKIVLAK